MIFSLDKTYVSYGENSKTTFAPTKLNCATNQTQAVLLFNLSTF